MSESRGLLDHLDVLRDLAAWFSAEKTPYCVIGGIAASVLGRSRTTRDVDAVIIAENERWADLLKAGESHGFYPRLPDALQFARRYRVFRLVHQPSGINADISVGGLPFEHEIMARARKYTVDDVTIVVPTPEDFVVMKAIAGRPHDWVDIESVLDAHPELDLRSVRKYLKQFAEVLDSPDMTERFESIVAQRRRVRSKRKST